MAKTLQHRRGTTTELNTVTGAVAEIFMDTTKNTLVVFDGVIGNPGHTLATEAFVLANAGTSYDQSLNTTDDVLFNSALIGDVSIVGNTIAGIDSYGIASDLILDGTVVYSGTTTETPVNTSTVNKWMKVGAQVPSTVLSPVTYNGTSWMSASYNSVGQVLTIDVGSPPNNTTFEQQLLGLTPGAPITILISGYGSYNVTLNSFFSYSGATSELTATVNENLGLGPTISLDSLTLQVSSNTGPLETQYFYMPLYK